MIRIRHILISCVLCLVSCCASAQQETFSKRFSLGANNLIFRSVLPLGDEFLVVGPVFGDEPFVYNGTQLAVFSEFGVLIDSSRLRPSNARVESWGTQIALGDNGDVFFAGNNYDRGKSFFAGKFDGSDYSPDYSVYRNPDFPASDFTFLAGVMADNERLFIYGGINRRESTVGAQQGIILEFSNSLEFVDTTYFPALDPYSYQLRDLIKRKNGGYYGLVQINEIGERCRPEQRFIVFHLDDDFEIVDSYISTEEEAWQNGRIYEDEYGDVYLQLAEVDYRNFIIDPNDCISTLLFSPRLMKLDSNLNRVWTRNLNRQVDSLSGHSGVAEVLPASDGPGMVAISSQFNKKTLMANLIRFDTAGNKLWHRTYGFFDTTDTSVFVYDAKVANDGGYVMVGEVRVERTQENLDLGRFPTQQGWIMKVDENGCLIPGCGSETVITSIVPGERSSPRVTLYPNPVEDMLMFRLDGVKDARSVSGQIYDLGGKLVRSVPERRLVEDMTLMLDVDQLKAGIYFLHLRLDNGRVVSEKFVKR